MRFMMLVKANDASEAGTMPSEQEIADMMRYNEQLADAGALVSGEGLHPSARGARIRYSSDGATVTDGPFAETKELIAGFWIIEVGSREDAIAWAKRVPFTDGEVELRQIFEADDFGESFTPELRQQEDALRARIDAQHA